MTDSYKRKVTLAHKAAIQQLVVRKADSVRGDSSVYSCVRYSDTIEELSVTLSVNWDELVKFLAAKARRSKGKRSSALRGMVKLKVDKATVLTRLDSKPLTVPDRYADPAEFTVKITDLS